MHNDTILDTIVTNPVLDEEGCCHPQQKDSGPLPTPPPNMPAIVYDVGRGLLVSGEASVSPPDKLTISYCHPVASHSSPFPPKGAATSNTNVWKHNC